MTVKEFYDSCGGGYEEIHLKFPADATLLVFLKIYARDTNYQALLNCMEAGDAEGAFAAVHTFKGMVLNLNLKGLVDPVNSVTEALRARDMQKAKEFMPALAVAVENTNSALGKLLGG